ncbi:DUF7507 domain-containing protein [Leifsonia aquatica]|uniref:DUF7507 domain-containing protein n=1 Tax=Leifsonia aquatica TaxID=144185 RepID=UPI003D30178B
MTNACNLALRDVKVEESAFTGTCTLSEIDCPAEFASVAPTVTCTATLSPRPPT